jgi:DNA-binding MarR family transcriptional regulator
MTNVSRAPTIAGMPARAEEVVLAPLRAARGAYADAVRPSAGGFADLPRNGLFVLAGTANRGRTPADLIRDLGVSKQAVSQLLDALVLRGYLDRAVDQDDRRRVAIALTERGRAAAPAVRAGVEGVEAELAARVSADELHGLMASRAALARIRAERTADGERPRGRRGRLPARAMVPPA